MNTIASRGLTSEQARRRMLADRFEPLFYANWNEAVFIHYECDPNILQQEIPFALDRYHDRAFVSVVAFTLHRMRPSFGGPLGEWLMLPIATHHFFNVRTYVVHEGEPGIFFMAEWLSNRLSVMLGPLTFGLPYRYGRIEYQNSGGNADVAGRVHASAGSFVYRGELLSPGLLQCEEGSLAEFLLERYTAFTGAGRTNKFFRVWHQPWQQCEIDVEIKADDLLGSTGRWWAGAKLVGANFSPGVNVWMGWPHKVET